MTEASKGNPFEIRIKGIVDPECGVEFLHDAGRVAHMLGKSTLDQTVEIKISPLTGYQVISKKTPEKTVESSILRFGDKFWHREPIDEEVLHDLLRKMGAFIRAKRREAELTQEKLSSWSNVSKQYLSVIEKGRHWNTGKPVDPSLEILSRLAAALDIEQEDLFAMAGYEIAESPASDPPTTL